MASCTFALIPSLIFGDHLQCGNRSQSLTKKYLDSKSKKGFHSILIFIWYGRFFLLMLLQNMLTPVDDVEVLVLVDNKTDSLSRSQESSKLQPAQIHLPMDHLRLITPFFRWAPQGRVAVNFLCRYWHRQGGGRSEHAKIFVDPQDNKSSEIASTVCQNNKTRKTLPKEQTCENRIIIVFHSPKWTFTDKGVPRQAKNGISCPKTLFLSGVFRANTPNISLY